MRIATFFSKSLISVSSFVICVRAALSCNLRNFISDSSFDKDGTFFVCFFLCKLEGAVTEVDGANTVLTAGTELTDGTEREAHKDDKVRERRTLLTFRLVGFS